MADDKKGGKKDAPAPVVHPLVQDLPYIIVGIIVFILISTFVQQIATHGGTFSSYIISMTGGSSSWYPLFQNIVEYVVTLYVRIAIIVSVFLVLGIVYALYRFNKVMADERKKDVPVERVGTTVEVEEREGSSKWQRVIAHVNSNNPAEWRLAILEADVMLEDALRIGGFHGDTIGDMLKNTTSDDFRTLQLAWEGHKIRNAIAHEGAEFLVNQREAKRVVGLFEQVFRDLLYI